MQTRTVYRSSLKSTIDEDVAIGTEILKVKASDNHDFVYTVSDDTFAIDSDGVISSNRRLDADDNGAYYEFMVTMSAPVRIYTKNRNDEAPQFSRQVYKTTLDDDARPNTLVTAVVAKDKVIKEVSSFHGMCSQSAVNYDLI